ncbi:MAG: hypothetical protein E6J26_11110, partial [Chloroflexi bacterium]
MLYCTRHYCLARAAKMNRHLRFVAAKRLALIGALPVALVLALLALLAPPPTVVSAGPDGLRVLRSDLNGVVLELDVPSYQLTQRRIDGVKYDVLSAPGLDLRGAAPGAPQLPLRGVAVAVPQAAAMSVRVLDAQAEEVPQSLRLLPMPTQQIDRSSGEPFTYRNLGLQYIPDAALYARAGFEPQSPFSLGSVGYMRSQRFVQLTLYPFAYNAVQQKVRWIKRLTIEIRFAYAHGPDVQAVGSAHDEGPYEKILQQQIVNYDNARTWRMPARSAPRPQTP